MATTQPMTVNEDHEPSAAEEQVLNIFKHERAEYQSSRMTPQLIRKRAPDVQLGEGEELSKQYVNYALGQLTAAGWVDKIADGLYEFVDDPRK